MIVGTILLDENDCYTYDNGKLPGRPDFDKELLTFLTKNNTVSHEGYRMLPMSIKRVTYGITHGMPTFPVTIPEIDALSDLLIVSRGKVNGENGKKFRFNRFELITTQREIELWKRKNDSR